MDVAISGDRSSCLTQELASGVYLFAVAHGFGRIDGEPIASVVLSRLRNEVERRTRGRALSRVVARPKGVNNLLTGAFNRTNEYVHARSASHEDYVTAGCSVTAALLFGDRAYLSHVGSTAAYLGRGGYVVALTKHDAFEDEGLPVLTRALGADSTIDLALCSFSLAEGDSLVFSGRRLNETEMAAGGSAEHVLVVRYAPEATPYGPGRRSVRRFEAPAAGAIAAVLFYVLLCLH